MKKLTKVKAIATGVAATGGAIALSATAFGYWTGGGSGSGTVNAGRIDTTIALVATVADGIYPSGTRTVTFTASNPNISPVYITSVSVASMTADKAGCDVAWFSMPTVTQNYEIAGNASGVTLPSNGTLTMANTATNQDACKGAVITLNLTSV